MRKTMGAILRLVIQGLRWAAVMVVASSLIAGFNILVMIGHRVWTGGWSFYSLGDFMARFGWVAPPKLAGWPVSVVWLILGFAAFGALTDADQPYVPPPPSAPREKRPMRLPRFFWPRSRHLETTVLIRLGRMVHWLSVGVAAASIMLAVVIGVGSLDSASRNAESIRQWDIAHPTGQADPADPYEVRPYPMEPYLGSALLFGTLAALSVALAGRGVRYILANE